MMITWRTYCKSSYKYGEVQSRKYYKWLLLFGFIPLYVSIIKEGE